MALSVHEVTMAAPDIVCVEVRDPPVTPGEFRTVTAESVNYLDAPTFTWVADAPSYYAIVGADKKRRRYQDTRAEEYLDRAAAGVAANYGMIGGLTVTNVYIRSEPYDFGEGRWNTVAITNKATSHKHFLFLKLSGSLSQGGPYTIDFPAGTGLANHDFTFSDLSTRAIAIRATQHGHRPSDVSKIGYLALWVPGAASEGVLNFASTYSLTSFEVINGDGIAQFTGSIVERVTPTETENGTGFSRTSVRYASTTNARMTISGVTKANPAVVTVDDASSVSNGDIIHIRGTSRNGVDGMPQVDINYSGAAYTVANKSGNTFELSGINSTSYGTFGGYGYVYKTHQANRAGTYVYDLDYSAWTVDESNPGPYRIRIPGLGVSDPFYCHDGVWFGSAAVSAKGEYHQRSGLALDGRFGYTRPVNFKSGVSPSSGITAQTIYKSDLPYIATNYTSIISTSVDRVPLSRAVDSLWRSATEETQFWGSWQDAGDWDIRLLGTYGEMYGLLDLVERFTGCRAIDFAVPKSSECLDTVTYPSSTDALPDLVHQVIWGLDPFRRSQAAGGEIVGGMTYSKRATRTFTSSDTNTSTNQITISVNNFANASPCYFTTTGTLPAPLSVGTKYFVRSVNNNVIEISATSGGSAIDITDGGTGTHTIDVTQSDSADQGGYAFEPSWMFHGQAVTYAPDHLSTFAYAGCAAKLARVLSVLGFSALSTTWQTSAIAAWGRAEAIYSDATTRDAFYLTLKTKAGWSTTQYNNAIADFQVENQAKSVRRFAAGCLFALTGDSAYGNVIVTDWNAGPFQLDATARVCGAWEYSQSAGADGTVAAAIEAGIVNNAANYTDYSEGNVAYRTIHHKNLDMSFGKDCGTIGIGALLLTLAHQISGQSKYIAALQAGMCFIQGANQKGLCLTKGLGARNIKAYLHLDSHCMGVAAPDGLTPYGYSEQSFVTSFNFQVGNTTYIQDPTNNETADYEANRIMSPTTRRAFPVYESMFENFINIEQMEYTTQETILPALRASVYLHCWDRPTGLYQTVRLIASP